MCLGEQARRYMRKYKEDVLILKEVSRTELSCVIAGLKFQNAEDQK